MFECLQDAGFGHGISAPQIGIRKRLICLDLDGVRRVIVNPTLELVGSETMELMDDCLCFPGLLVKVRRNRRCIVRYRDENWQVQELACEDYLSELIQHEYDHLNGVLATMRAVDGKAFVMKKARRPVRDSKAIRSNALRMAFLRLKPGGIHQRGHLGKKRAAGTSCRPSAC